MNYKKITGKCKNCGGCMRLENPYFIGTNECKYADEPRQETKKILRIGEQIKI